jgi:16S rRNA (adenine1518-N6/adenine1519-N6)-dimethyltransferase
VGDPSRAELRIPTRTDIMGWLEDSGRAPRRGLGQNFVVDPNTIRRIVRLAGVEPGDQVVEIGPGYGSLTAGLVEAGATVLAIEKDGDLADDLTRRVPASVTVHTADARDVDFDELTAGRPSALVANLPYNVAATLVIDILESAASIVSGLIMVQREVAERLVAPPGSKTFGIPSLRVAYRAEASIRGGVPADVFYPRPRVASALVGFDRLSQPAVEVIDSDLMWKLVKSAFGQRRKMLRSSLSDVSAEQFAVAGLEGRERPEELGLEQWGRLTDAVTAR